MTRPDGGVSRPWAGDGAADDAIPLLGASEIRALAADAGLRPTKSWGQNFVVDANTVARIARLAQVGRDDVVLEVGPGLGSLTLALLQRVQRVTAVEIDPTLAALLPRTVAERTGWGEAELGARLGVVHADALRVTAPDALHVTAPDAARGPSPHGSHRTKGQDLIALPGPPPTALVANLPYNVAVPVLLTLLARLPSLRRALVMVQWEVAERLAARAGEAAYGVPSVKAAWYGTSRLAGSVPRSVFWPVPRVDSGLVELVRTYPPATRATREEVFALVDAAFAQRRKTLRAALAGWAGGAPAAETILRAAGVDPGARGERLDVADFARIAQAHPRTAPARPGIAPARPGIAPARPRAVPAPSSGPVSSGPSGRFVSGGRGDGPDTRGRGGDAPSP